MFKPAYARLISSIIRFKMTLIVAICMSASVAALVFGPPSSADPAPPSGVARNRSAPAAPQTPNTFKPVVTTAAASGISPVASTLPLVQNGVPTTWESDRPLPLHPPHTPPTLPVQDSVQQTSAGSLTMPAAIQSFDGLAQGDGCGNCVPPDPNGAVGPNHSSRAVRYESQKFSSETRRSIVKA